MQILALALIAVCAEPEPEASRGFRGFGLAPLISRGGLLGHSLLAHPHGLHRVALRPHGLGKREAEAEPEADPEALDPSLHWGHGGVILGSPLGLLGHGLVHRPHGLHRVALRPHGLGKREAEAEPEAEPEADPGYRWGRGSLVVGAPLISRVGLLGHGLVHRPLALRHGWYG